MWRLGLGVGNRVLECFVLFLCCDCVVNSSSSPPGVPEQEPRLHQAPCRAICLAFGRATFTYQGIGGGLCLPNLEPGGWEGLPRQTPRKRSPSKTPPPAKFEITPPPSPVTLAVMAAAPNPRPPTT